MRYQIVDSFLGMLEAVRIRKCGFTIRRTFDEFNKRFRVLFPRNSAISQDSFTNCKTILRSLPQLRDLADHSTKYVQFHLENSTVRYRFGKTKIFFKEKEYYGIETLREQRMQTVVTNIQRVWRGYKIRKMRSNIQRNIIVLQTGRHYHIYVFIYRKKFHPLKGDQR